ncbi:co-chaperone GroES [Marinobacter sp. JSM 1782161]|uniref:co-chaperone GroES n=1 Tax=Marinobacter sp. JSM 1782161 TaxID=2685906 RepID=UPI001402E2F6|nr:co-chaperone GroES [Marinobacter sp. JSM 1782161]
MQIRPLYDRVVVRRLEAETLSRGGILIPEKSAEKPTQGEVLAVGEGALRDNGERQPMTVKVGDRVLFAKFAGTGITLDDDTCLVVRESDILAVIEDAQAQEHAA